MGWGEGEDTVKTGRRGRKGDTLQLGRVETRKEGQGWREERFHSKEREGEEDTEETEGRGYSAAAVGAAN